MHDFKPLREQTRDQRPALPILGALWTLIIAAGALLGGCTGDEPEVVVYVSADEFLARQVLDRFEDETGISVRMVGDTEVQKTTGLVQRLRNEADNPQADVFWSSEIFHTIDLADEGVFESYRSPVAPDWPQRFVDEDHRWYGFAARARVIVYNPARVPKDMVPATWMDLTDERFKGRVVMADPRFGTTGGHLGAMRAYWSAKVSPQYYEAFIEGLAANDTRLLASGNAGVVGQVASGEADVGMTDTDDVWVAVKRGLAVELVYPNHEAAQGSGTGTLLIPNTVALVANGPNADNGRKLVDFLLSAEVERMIAESDSHNIPVRPGLAEEYPEYAVTNPLRVPFDAAAAHRAEAVALAMQMLSDDAAASTAKADMSEPGAN